MAGGKETPRQKMIGMMYLVLTALLALNVSKQIIAAFVTINDKLDRSAHIIHDKNEHTYGAFDKKLTTVKAQGGDTKTVEKWMDKSHEVREETKKIVSFLLGECNKMIGEAEGGKDWVQEKDEEGNILKLEPLADLTAMDNYDVPTNMFIGGNPENPAKEGKMIREKVLEYRNKVAEIMATYKVGDKQYSFKVPENIDDLPKALESANPDDTVAIANFVKSLEIPEKITQKIHGNEITHPWPSAMFDHAPIVAAAAIFTSLKLDVKNAEATAVDFLLSKVDVNEFDFNTIEPLAFAEKAYINQGDSLSLNVMIAAYDSTEIPDVLWGQDADTSEQDNWKPATNEKDGSIVLKGEKPGPHKVKGVIMVKQRGVKTAKPWEFDYTVGQPMGVVALPEMRVLYWGYDNIVEGTASGFPPDKVKLSGSGVSLSQKGKGQYVAKVGRGTRKASISVSGMTDDGGSVSLGKFDFLCKPMPPATLYFGKTESGGVSPYVAAKNQSRVRVGLDPSVPLTNVKYTVGGGQVIVAGIPGAGKVNRGGTFDGKAKSLLKQSKGKTVIIEVKYKGPDGIGRVGTMSFKVK